MIQDIFYFDDLYFFERNVYYAVFGVMLYNYPLVQVAPDVLYPYWSAGFGPTYSIVYWKRGLKYPPVTVSLSVSFIDSVIFAS